MEQEVMRPMIGTQEVLRAAFRHSLPSSRSSVRTPDSLV